MKTEDKIAHARMQAFAVLRLARDVERFAHREREAATALQELYDGLPKEDKRRNLIKTIMSGYKGFRP
jgi:hypothetical protein